MFREQMSTVERIRQQRQEAEDAKIIAEGERQEWREAVNRIIETPEGKLFFEKMLKFIDPFEALEGINPQNMAEINGRRTFYFKFVRPYLEKHNRIKVE